MAVTAETRKAIIELVVTAYNAAPGTTLLTELVQAVDGGASLADVATTLTTSSTFNATYPVFQTSTEFATEFLGNLVPSATEAQRAEGIAAIEFVLNSGGTRADVVLQAQTFLAGLDEADAGFGEPAAAFNNKVEVAEHHTLTLEQADSSTSAIATVTSDDTTVEAGKEALGGGAADGGQTFLATTGTDTVVGTPGNDVVNAPAGTFNAGDTIDGGAGTDTLNVTWTGTGPAQSASTLKNVEVLNLTASPNPASLSVKGVTGITAINNLNSANGATVTVSDVGAPVDSTLTGIQAATTIGYTTAVTASTATSDKSTLTLAGTALGASYTATGIEEVTVNSTKSANTLSSLGVSSATKITVTGDQDLTINGEIGGSKLTSVDASAFTGKNLTLEAGDGAGSTAKAGVTVTLPTSDTVTTTVETQGNKDTITLGAGNATVTAGGGDDTITAGAGTNVISSGAGNDSITLTGTKDTLRYAETGSSNADNITGFTSSSVIAVNLGTAATSTANASADSDFGIVQSGATSPTIGNVDGTGTGTAISFATVSASASTAISGSANVLALNGAFTDGTAAGVATALGTSATTQISTNSNSKFLVATYSVGNIAQVWAYNGDDDADGNIDGDELALVATLTGVNQNSLTASNFATYLTTSTEAGTVVNTGQTIEVSTQKTLIQDSANAAGQLMTAADDTVTVNTGFLPTGAATDTMGLTIIDPNGSDNDTLSATVLNSNWEDGTLLSNIENVNLEFLTADNDGWAVSSIMPGTDTVTISGVSDVKQIHNIISGTTIGIGSSYTGTIEVDENAAAATIAALELDLNGSNGSTSAKAATFEMGATLGGAGQDKVTAFTINANADSSVNLVTDVAELVGITLKGSGDVKIYDTIAQIADANITAADLTYTGKFTLSPTDASLGGDLDFTETNEDVVGLDVLDLSVADGALGGGRTVTLPAVTGGGDFTITHSPSSSAALGGDENDLIIVQSGTSSNDKVTLSLGANSTGTTLADIVADNTDNLVISSSAASSKTVTIDDIQIETGAGAQSVTISGAATFDIGDVNADTITVTGKAVTIANLSNATGTTVVKVGSSTTDLTITAAGGAADVNVTGGDKDDSITTGAGDDVINGGGGADVISSGDGLDQITTGPGADKINMGTIVAAANAVTVTDFTAGSGGDILQLRVATLNGASSDNYSATDSPTISTVANQTNTANEIIVDTAANILAADFSGNANNDHNIAIASDTGAIYYDADGDYAGGGSVQIGTLTITGTLAAANFEIIA
ncbi:MAG: hypothetical protein PsegKO_00530 [Pseudohongiellaceae bacterium]